MAQAIRCRRRGLCRRTRRYQAGGAAALLRKMACWTGRGYRLQPWLPAARGGAWSPEPAAPSGSNSPARWVPWGAWKAMYWWRFTEPCGRPGAGHTGPVPAV